MVGADGATHAGSFDTAYLANLPNMVVMAAADEAELTHMVATAAAYDDGPVAFRYPRGEGARLGIEIEKRPYRPHVTVARKAKLPLSTDIEAIDWSATEFVLVESISTAQGVRYNVLKRWPLRSA